MPALHTDPNLLYGPARVAAMHEIAAFVLISKSLHEIRNEFKNHADIDFVAAKPRANRILKSVREVTASLLAHTLKNGDEEHIAKRIAHVRCEAYESILEAVEDAKALMQQEVEALEKQGVEKANFVRLGVYQPLLEITTRWNALDV